jgi:hypothetical protein
MGKDITATKRLITSTKKMAGFVLEPSGEMRKGGRNNQRLRVQKKTRKVLEMTALNRRYGCRSKPTRDLK